MHVRGSATIADSSPRTPVLALACEEVALGDGRVVTATFEMPMDLSLLPPALNPTIPMHVSFVLWDLPASAYGAARLVQVRAGCNVGVLPRGFVTAAFSDNDEFGQSLRDAYGLPVRSATIELVDTPDGPTLDILEDHINVLGISATAPQRIEGGSAALFSRLSLALVQASSKLVQLERSTAELSGWGPAHRAGPSHTSMSPQERSLCARCDTSSSPASTPDWTSDSLSVTPRPAWSSRAGRGASLTLSTAVRWVSTPAENRPPLSALMVLRWLGHVAGGGGPGRRARVR